MKTQLPEKYNNSFWSKIKNFFRGIFSSKENTELNNNIEYNKKQNEESFYKEENENLQKKYE